MTHFRHYRFEFALLAAALVIAVLGFWELYFGPRAQAQPHHHLHLATAFMWLTLLVVQLGMIASNRRDLHRTLGLSVLVAGPLLVAVSAMLSVHSAHKGVVSGEGDRLIMQNVPGTLELALFIVLAFLLKRRRKLHASFLLATSILFMGVALFFALISFAPPFRIEGPETFYRFGTAAMTGQAITLAVGLLFFLRDWRNNWPYLLAAACFPLNTALGMLLGGAGMIDPLTEFVGSFSQPLTFVTAFAVMFALLYPTAMPKTRQLRLA